MTDNFQPTEQTLSKRREIEELLNNIDKNILHIRIQIDNEFGDGFQKYHSALFNIELMIKNAESNMLSTQGYDSKAVRNIVCPWINQIELLKQNLRIFERQKNIVTTKYLYEHYMKMNSEFQSLSGRYVIIAHAAAIVACLSALPSSWENTNFIVILLYCIFLFGFGIAISATSLFLKNILDVRYERFYSELLHNNKSPLPHKNIFHRVISCIYIQLNSLSLLIFSAATFIGIANLLQMKGAHYLSWHYFENFLFNFFSS